MFKVGKIISLYKGEKKDKCDRINCRDITLTFVVSKLLEKLILSRMENEYFIQWGFSRDHDAMPACYISKEAISYNVNKGLSGFSFFFLSFLDDEKAPNRS